MICYKTGAAEFETFSLVPSLGSPPVSFTQQYSWLIACLVTSERTLLIYSALRGSINNSNKKKKENKPKTMVEIKMIHTSVHLSKLFYIPMKQVLSWSHFIHSRLHEDDGTWWRLSVVVPEENDSDWPHCGALISYFSKHGILSCGFTSSQSCGVTFRVLNTSSVVLCLLTFILQCRIPDYVFIPFMVFKKACNQPEVTIYDL